MRFFESVRYHISPSLTPEQREFLKHLLINNGAEPAEGVKDATHIITNSDKFEGWQSVGKDAHVVTEKWVERSLVMGKVQPPQFYSAKPAELFSGVIACATELPIQDLEVLSAGILAMGGQWRTGLTKEVTHLFAISTTSAKYTTALHLQQHTGTKIVLPHWYDDVVRLGAARLDTKPYEWPEPELLKNRNLTKKEGDVEEEKVKKAMAVEDNPMKRSVYSTAVKYAPLGNEEVKIPPPPTASHTAAQTKQVWDGRRVLLSRNLLLFGSRREAVEVGIRRAGGEVVRWDGDEEVDEEGASEARKSRNEKRRQRQEADAVESCDIYISRWREGRAYVKAYRQQKTIGTLAWLYHVQATGTITRPLDQLLHYPVPERPIEGFRHHEITITNYTGEAREYLKKLIMVMGATFTASMSAKNTVLVAASKDGTKSTKALSWSIPVVNHRWLEDCFTEWKSLTYARDKYIHFPQGTDYSTILADQGVGMSPRIEEEVEQMEEDYRSDVEEEVVDEEDEQDVDMDIGMHMNVDVEPGLVGGAWRRREETEEVDAEEGVVPVPPPPMGTAGSMREVEALVDGDVQMGEPAPPEKDDDDDDEPPLPPPRSSVSPAKKSSRATPKKAAATPKKPQSDSETEEEDDPEPTPRRRGRPVGSTKREEPVAARTRSRSRGPRTRSQSRPRGEAAAGSSSKVQAQVTKANTKANARGGRGRSVSRVRSQSRGRGRSRRRDDTEDEEDDRRGRSAKSKSKGRGRSSSRGRGRRRQNESEEEEEEEEQPRKKGKKKRAVESRSRSRSRGRGRKKEVESETEEEDDDEVRPSKSTKAKPAPPKSKPRKKRSSPTPSDSEDDEIEIIQDLRPAASAKRAKGVVKDEEEGEDDEGGGEDEIVVVKKGPPVGRAKSKGKEKERKLPSPLPLDEDSDEDLPDLSTVMTSVPKKDKPAPTTLTSTSTATGTASKAKATAKDKSKAGPQAQASTSASKTKLDAKEKGKKPAVSTKGKGKEKMVIDVDDDDDDDEDQADAVSAMDEDEPPAPPPPTKKGPPVAARRKSGPAQAQPPPPPPRAEAPVAEITSQVSTHSRRAAAAKASAQLRDVIMPDVMNFENQMRKSRKSGAGLAGFVVEGDTLREGKEKAGSSSSAGKRKKAEAKQEERGEEEEEREKEEGVEKVEKGDGQKAKRRKVGVKEGAGKSEEKEVVQERRVIKIATTQVVLPDDAAKTLAKLGATVTARPSECTHLLAAGIVRTEKFLCAIANGAHILRKEWATDSAKAGKILSEANYMLKDPGNKHGVDLQQSLERSRKAKLFAGKTFYVAGKTIANTIPLLKNVVAASGGQLREAQKLTQRVIAGGEERYAVSSPEDISLWRQLGEAGTPVYSVELIIAGTLKQTFDPESARLEWANDS